MPDDVQPAEGQGAEGGSPFDSYLQSVPEGAQEAAQKWFSDTSKGLNQKLEEAAEFRKQWEPYGSIEGLRDYQPEDLQGLIGWHQQVYSNPDAARQWWEQMGQENGWSAQETAEAEGAQEDLEAEGFTPEQAQKMVADAVAPLQEQYQELVLDRNSDVEAEAMHTKITELAKDRGLGELTPEQRAIIYELGYPFSMDEQGNELPVGDTSWVEKGLDRFQSIYAEGQRAFVEEKTSGPAAALTKGGTEGAKPITSFDEANKAMRARWAESHK